MKILVVSDTHGRDRNFDEILKKVKPIDMLIHCGDLEGSEEHIRQAAGCPVHMVSGNNDFFSNLEREEEFRIGKYRVLLTHGHYYYVSMSTQRIRQEAEERGCSLVLFGHTHRPLIERHSHITLCNPGSLSYPRQDGRRPSYLILELDREGEMHYTLDYC